jgi:hypothetical protein
VEVPKKRCDTTYEQKCTDYPKENCHTVIDKKCTKYPRELCSMTYRDSCHTYPHQVCKDVKTCVKVPETKCWPAPEKQCKQVPREECRKVPKQKCWKVAIKKNRYVKKKYCQKCRKQAHKYSVKKTRTRCALVPRQECRTVHKDECQQVPYEDCHTYHKEQCGYEKQCRTEQQLKCEKPKPGYGAAPSYDSVKEQCKSVPVQKCWKEKKCQQVPQHQCATRYHRQCHQVPSQKCETIKDKHCTPYTVDEPATHVTKTCYWPPRYNDDRFCTRRSDDDVLLDAGTEFADDIEYLGEGELLDKIDYLSVFPGNYSGNPNETHPAAAHRLAAQLPWPPVVEPTPPTSALDKGNIDYTQDDERAREETDEDSSSSAADPQNVGGDQQAAMGDTYAPPNTNSGLTGPWQSTAGKADEDEAPTQRTPMEGWGFGGGGDGFSAPPAIASFFASQMSQGFQDRRRRRLDLSESVTAPPDGLPVSPYAPTAPDTNSLVRQKQQEENTTSSGTNSTVNPSWLWGQLT